MYGKRLGVNVDHSATIRNARGTAYPDPVFVALLAEKVGAHQITIHLREDRRHIVDRDLAVLKEVLQVDLNLEMAATEEMVTIACDVMPDRVTLVPEKRAEQTTEGGLDVAGDRERLTTIVGRLNEAGIPVSMFIEPDERQIDASATCGAAAVELHTGRYCDAENDEERTAHLAAIERTANYAADKGLEVAAGHGLDYLNVEPVAAIETIEELNIGHSIIARAIVLGIEDAVAEMLEMTC
jgi:pyridoxine 5-phosphate synthase